MKSRACVVSVLIAQFFFTHSAFARGNSMPVHVGGALDVNGLIVSVKVCAPGTHHCQTIPNILIDTGAVGLKLYSALTIKPKPLLNSAGNVVAECQGYGGGQQEWGAIQTVDVILGHERVRNLNVKVTHSKNPGVPAPPATCAIPNPDEEVINGYLGLGVNPTDYSYNTDGYFSCVGDSCTQYANVPAAEQIQNPVTLMKKNNNGIMIQLPAVSEGGSKSVDGKLIFGIGTAHNNRVNSKMNVFQSDSAGWFKVQYKSETYYSKIDTGSDAWVIPNPFDVSIPHCLNDDGTPNRFLCPLEPVTVNISLLANSGKTAVPVSFQLEQHPIDLVAYSNLGMEPLSDWPAFIIGMPFFYGKTVAFAIDGKSTPLGVGPYYAY